MWKSISSSLKRNGKYALGLVIASLVGGLMATVAQAAIPDSSGSVNACYKGTKTFYLTDPAANCRAGENAISWDKGVQAYGHLFQGSNGQYTIDTANSLHVASVSAPDNYPLVACITFDSTVVSPKQILVSRDRPGQQPEGADIVGIGTGNGGQYCEDNPNAVVYTTDGSLGDFSFRVY